MIEFMYNIRTEKGKLVGPILLVCLLFLRLPYLVGVTTLFPHKPFLIDIVFNDGTFFITALLIWWERKRLSEFHITLGVLRLIIWTPLVSLIVGFIIVPMSLVRLPLLLPQILISFWLLWNLKKGNFNNLPRTHHWLRWIIIGVIVGLCLAISLSYFIGLQDIGGVFGKHRTIYESVLMLQSVKSWVTVLPLFLVQLSSAAILEEPLFRGFLWGYLRISGWKEMWILVFQAFLFWIGHVYYWNNAPYSFWLAVPIGAFVLGILAWKSRSIGTSMITHGLMNSLGDFLAHW